jgi:hypothetical protein
LDGVAEMARGVVLAEFINMLPSFHDCATNCKGSQ